MREELENIRKGFEVRKNLIALRSEIKEPTQKRALAYKLGGDFSIFTGLLEDADPKSRKNAALILGEMECDDLLPLLYKAYEKEAQLFVRADYLKAMAHCDYAAYVPKLKECLRRNQETRWDESDIKHVREENAVLRSMVLSVEKPKKHKFTGYEDHFDVILMTNRNFGALTLAQAEEEESDGKSGVHGGTVRLETSDIKKLFNIRTYTEMLFPVKGASRIQEREPEAAARVLARSGLVSFLEENHRGDWPFYFRVELKGKMPLEKKGNFIRKFAAALENYTDGRLCNYASDYEIEIRLIEKQAGGFIPLLKLYTYQDKRFEYRQNALASSISPVNAAIMMQLAKPYMKEGAQVLDPFCGVGTMLIERDIVKKANPLYGVDIFPEAVDKGRENAEKAGTLINFINRDILSFKHEYLFDEIVSDLPAVTKTKDKGQILELYSAFLDKAKEFLKRDAYLFLYTPESDVLERCLKEKAGYEVEDSWIFNEREGSIFYIIRYHEE